VSRVRQLFAVGSLVCLAAVARAGTAPAPSGDPFSLDQVGASQDHSVDALLMRKLREFARRSLLQLETVAAGLNEPLPGHPTCMNDPFCNVSPDTSWIFSNAPPAVPFGASSRAESRTGLLPEPVANGLVAVSVMLLMRARRRDHSRER